MPQSTTQLVQYDKARHALAQCERIDEAKDWADKAAALSAYAKQADDPELEATARRIRSRAFRRMGEISRELEKGSPGPQGEILPSAGKYLSKSAVLAEAGISTSQAHRAEKVAAIPVEEFERRVESDTPPPITALLDRARRPRSGNATHDNDDEWYTPPRVVSACRAAMGGIDLDPASHEVANRCVKAKRYFTVEDDGLAQPWAGRVFLNPPYSRQAGKAAFIVKLSEAFDEGTVTAATVVLSYDFSASWFEPLRGRYAAICLCRGRVQFYKDVPGDGHDPALGTSLVYLGPDVGLFAQAVSELGDVVIPYGC